MRSKLALVAAFALATVAALASSNGLAAQHEDVVEIELVETGDDEAPFAFEPDEVTVSAGTTVRWVHTHDVFHTVTSTDSLDEREPNGEFDQSLSSEGETFEHTFEQPGTYHYFCKPHSGFMFGTIHVEGEGETAETTDAPTGVGVALVAGLVASALVARDRRRT